MRENRQRRQRRSNERHHTPTLAALDRRLEALATLAYGPLPMNEYRVDLGNKLAVLLLFAALVAIAVAAQS